MVGSILLRGYFAVLCQNCHQNPATIHLQMNLNGQRVQLDLCQNCYQKLQNMQTNMMNGGNGMNNFGFGSLEDFMNAMNNMQSQQAAGNGAAFSGQNQRQGGNGKHPAAEIPRNHGGGADRRGTHAARIL